MPRIGLDEKTDSDVCGMYAQPYYAAAVIEAQHKNWKQEQMIDAVRLATDCELLTAGLPGGEREEKRMFLRTRPTSTSGKQHQEMMAILCKSKET